MFNDSLQNDSQPLQYVIKENGDFTVTVINLFFIYVVRSYILNGKQRINIEESYLIET